MFMSMRLFIKEIRENHFTYKVPAHGNAFLYSLGAIVFVGFLLMIITGLILSQLYDPAPGQAYQSLQKIQQIGWTSYIRALHYFIAQGMIAALLLHIGRVFVTGAYKSPRQATWWFGVALFATMLMGSYFTGTILKWDEEGLDALAHYKESLRLLGPMGALLTEKLSGSGPMNIRVFASHIAVFPILIVFLALLHFFLVHAFNLSPTPKDPWADKPTIPEAEMKGRFDEHAKGIFIFSALYYGALAVLAFFFRAPLQGPPIQGHGAIKPPWPFLWMVGFENVWGVVAVLFGSAVLFGFLALVPLLDRKQDRRFQARRPILFIGGLIAIALIVLTIHGKFTEAKIHIHHHEEEPTGDHLPHDHPDAGHSDHDDVAPHDHADAAPEGKDGRHP